MLRTSIGSSFAVLSGLDSKEHQYIIFLALISAVSAWVCEYSLPPKLLVIFTMTYSFFSSADFNNMHHCKSLMAYFFVEYTFR